jgi:hypothetical protein
VQESRRLCSASSPQGRNDGWRRFNIRRCRAVDGPLSRIEKHYGTSRACVEAGQIARTVLAKHGHLVVAVEVADATAPLTSQGRRHDAHRAAGAHKRPSSACRPALLDGDGPSHHSVGRDCSRELRALALRPGPRTGVSISPQRARQHSHPNLEPGPCLPCHRAVGEACSIQRATAK